MFCTAGEIKDGVLRIGNTSVPVYTPETKMKVPDVLFYENAQVKLLTYYSACLYISSDMFQVSLYYLTCWLVNLLLCVVQFQQNKTFIYDMVM